jgi:hypothetical protein
VFMYLARCECVCSNKFLMPETIRVQYLSLMLRVMRAMRLSHIWF